MTHLTLSDFVYHGPFLAALKKKYPNLDVDIWFDDGKNRSKGWRSNRNQALEQWIKDTDIVSVVFPIAGSDDERQKLIRRGKRREYDIIVYFAATRPAQYVNVARKISKKALLVGNSPSLAWTNITELATFRKVDRRFVIQPDLGTKEGASQIFERYRERYEQCFGSLVLDEKHKQGLPVKTEALDTEGIESWLLQHNTGRDDDVIVVSPFASSQKQDLSAETLTEVVQTILSHRPHAHIVINVSQSAQIGVKAVLRANELHDNPNISLFTGSNDVRLLSALLKRANFIVTVENTVMHFASTFNRPQFAIIRDQAASRRPRQNAELFWCAESVHSIRGRELAPRMIGAIDSIRL